MGHEGGESAYVDLNGHLTQFLRAEVRADSEEPNAAYWEENWSGVDEPQLRHALRPTKRLGTHGGFFRRHLPTGCRILEAGCGTGFWMQRLRQNGYEVYGLDYACDSLKRSKSLVSDLDLCAGNLLGLPFQENSFDAYMSFGVIEHFIDGPGPILREALRVLRPGGVILASTPFLNTARKAVSRIAKEEAEARGLRFHQYFFTLAELNHEFEAAGFEALGDSATYSVWHGLQDAAPAWRARLSRVPMMSRLAYALDFVPGLGQRAAHMIFAVGRKPSR